MAGFTISHEQADIEIMDRDRGPILRITRTLEHPGIASNHSWLSDAGAHHALAAKGPNGIVEPLRHSRVPGARLQATGARLARRSSETTTIAVEEARMSNKVVAHFQDGRIIKGVSLDVDPAKPSFHVRPPTGRPVEVRLADLKALFYVRSLEGDPERHEHRLPDPADPRARGSTLVSLKFADGEEMSGLTIRYPPNRPFFFIVPVDAQSNNIRILINRSAIVASEPLPLG